MPELSSSASPSEREQILTVRHALLALHKILLELERQRFERANGRITDMFQLLNLTINDPAFAWLRPLSTLIVDIDEKLDDKDNPMTSAQVEATRREIRELLSANQVGNDFQRNYHWALQESPEAVISHGGIVKLLAVRS
jgi:hypothetical protein